MAGFRLRVVIVDGGDRTIKVEHGFWGTTEAEVRAYYREHLSSCSYFQSAKRDGRLIEELVELDDGEELPTPEDPFPVFDEYDDEDEYDEEEEELRG